MSVQNSMDEPLFPQSPRRMIGPLDALAILGAWGVIFRGRWSGSGNTPHNFRPTNHFNFRSLIAAVFQIRPYSNNTPTKFTLFPIKSGNNPNPYAPDHQPPRHVLCSSCRWTTFIRNVDMAILRIGEIDVAVPEHHPSQSGKY